MKSITLKLLIINCIVMVMFAILVFYQAYSVTERRIEQVVSRQAALALQFDLSIRRYVGDYIRPAMYALTNQDYFFPETMSTSFIARSIFEDVREQFPDYIIKFSSDNPRNPINKAGPEEVEIIEKFEADPELDQWEGQIVIDGKNYLAKFSVRRMVESCVRCHGDPAEAPASLVERYGDTAGFYRKIGDVLGLDTVAIPMEKVLEQRRSEFFSLSLYSGIAILLFFAATSLITRYLIIHRLSQISEHFINMANEEDSSRITPIAMEGNDEICALAASFNIMSDRLKQSYINLNDQVDMRTRELQKEVIERRQSEKRLRQSEEKFRAAFKTSPYVITFTSLEDGTYIEINDAFTRQLGYLPEEVVGRSALSLNIWKDVKDREKLVVGLERDGVVENLEAEFIGKDGRIIDGIMSARTVEIDNKKYLLSVTLDVTETRKNEQERLDLEIRLQQAQKVEAIGTLSGGIAHDFNNILSGIFGYSQLARTHIKNPERAAKYISRINEGAKRASSLIQQILTFSRQTEQIRRPLVLIDALREAMALIRSTIPANIEIKEELSSDGVVLADATQIHQVIMNLCTNAYHAMGDGGGVLTVKLDSMELPDHLRRQHPAASTEEFLRLEVSDTGHGIEQEIREKLFDPYFTTKKMGKGTGLGLAVVDGIVKKHDGFIEFNTVVDVGTTFMVYLPLITDKVPQMKQPGKKKESILKSSGNIMVVDDEHAILDTLEAIFSSQGYEVSTFDNGRSALAAFKKDPGRFDLLITDMTMPKMTGDKLSEAVMDIRPGFPVIICTGYHESFTRDDALQAGIKHFLQKPLAGNDLLEVVRELLA